MEKTALIATLAAQLSVGEISQAEKRALMPSDPPSCPNAISVEFISWHLQAEAKYRVRLAQAIHAESVRATS